MTNRERLGSPIASSNDVSAQNRVRVLQALQRLGPTSRVALAKETGMSPATVNRLTGALMRLGLVDQAGNDEATGGRPSMLVQFQPQSRFVLAMDLWEGAIEVALLDLAGQVVKRTTVPLASTDAQQKLDLLTSTVKSWTQEYGQLLAAIGISVPGPVTAEGVVLVAPALDWYDVDVRSPLQAVTHVPVTIENDVNLIAFAEHRHLAGSGQKTLVALAVFQGVGAGIVEEGRLWRGTLGAAGQFGRMLRDVSGLRHERHGFGHLETELGSDGILQRAINARVVSSEVDSADVVFASAQSGDFEALGMVRSVADEYAFHLVNVCAMIAPDIVVFAGLFARWSDLLIPMIEQRLEGNVIHLPELRTAELGDEGKLVGAGLYALEQAGGFMPLVSG